MLAGLVVASFTVTPTRRAQVSAAPTIENEPAAARIAPMSRGLARELRDIDGFELSVALSSTPEASAPTAVDVLPETLPEATVESAPEVTLEPEPEVEVIVEPEPVATPEPTPDPTPEPTPRPAAVLTNSTTLAAEVHMLELMNASRARGGLMPLVMDVGVADAARAHSAVEAQVRYVYHDGPDGSARSRNVPACGTGWYGENTGKIWNNNVDALHIEFMAEPWEPINHRTNIMDPAFRRVGVGAVNGPDAMYMTMVFCR
jgi:uncharacterized protein YkwD